MWVWEHRKNSLTPNSRSCEVLAPYTPVSWNTCTYNKLSLSSQQVEHKVRIRTSMLGTYLCNWIIFWQNAFYLYLDRYRMSLVLQETSVQVKYWSHASLTKKQVKEVFSLMLERSLDRILSIENYCWNSTEAWHKLYLLIITKLGFSDLIIRISMSICIGFLFSQF